MLKASRSTFKVTFRWYQREGAYSADHESSGTHKGVLKSSAVHGSMDAMERGVTVAPQLSRQEAVRQPILIEGAHDGSCQHGTSTLKEGWAALTAIESESLDRLLIGTSEKTHDEVTQSKVSAQKESRPSPHIDFTEPPSRQSCARLMDRNRTPSAMQFETRSHRSLMLVHPYQYDQSHTERRGV